MFTITVGNRGYSYNDKIVLKDLAALFMPEAIVAKVNNRLRELDYYIDYDCRVEFLDLTSFEAVRVYETSLRYLIIMALENLCPRISVRFGQGVSRSLACTVSGTDIHLSRSFVDDLEKEMRRLIALDLPIARRTITKEEAFEIYRKKGYHDKTDVLKYREEDTVNVYQCGEYVNYMFGYMVPSTGLLGKFRLCVYYPGFNVRYPRAECNGEIPEYDETPVFGKMIKDAEDWAILCGCDTIPKLNRHAGESSVVDLIDVCETRHNNMLAELGNIVKARASDLRLICIAGPSSSGKTTFSHRLRIQLLGRGLKTIKISMDNYYKDKSLCPRDENGACDLEHLEAIDLDLFNEHLLDLIEGQEIRLPVFDFSAGKRVLGKTVKIDHDTIIIIEGIHALNEEVTKSIPKHKKYKIYISPFSMINIDNHNPISATEIRMLRRIVRDGKYRKTDPSHTLAMWASVRRGEFKWIYPHQEQADYIFNSELLYEPAVMKKYALEALQKIPGTDENFVSANRLVKFLKYIRDIDDKYVPCNSILREFIGGSCYYNFFDTDFQ